MIAQEIDWKPIAIALAQRVNMAISYLKHTGTGTIFNTNTGGCQHWKDYFADALEMIPGCTVDREAMHSGKRAKTKKEASK